MPTYTAESKAKRLILEAVVIRADGTREDLGVVADSDWGGKIKSIFSKEARASKKRIQAANAAAEMQEG